MYGVLADCMGCEMRISTFTWLIADRKTEWVKSQPLSHREVIGLALRLLLGSSGNSLGDLECQISD